MLYIFKEIFQYIIHSHLFLVIIAELGYLWEGMLSVADDINSQKSNRCDLRDLTGKVALVTGGARGMGSVIVKRLLQCNAHVIIGCRNTSAGNKVVSKIRSSGISTGSVDVLELDLASFASIMKFADDLNGRINKLHILLNNAGIMFTPFSLTEDRYESQWQVNYLGPFLLTHLLYPLIHKTSLNSECRIVNVSSCAHSICSEIDYSTINNRSGFVTGISYANSKAAQISFTLYLSKYFKDNGINISVFAVHPGIVDTDLFNGTFVKKTMPWLLNYAFKSPDEGATSVLYPCISPDLSDLSGLYLSNCRPIISSKFTRDFLEQKKLFDYCLESLHIKDFGSTLRESSYAGTSMP